MAVHDPNMVACNVELSQIMKHSASESMKRQGKACRHMLNCNIVELSVEGTTALLWHITDLCEVPRLSMERYCQKWPHLLVLVFIRNMNVCASLLPCIYVWSVLIIKVYSVTLKGDFNLTVVQ